MEAGCEEVACQITQMDLHYSWWHQLLYGPSGKTISCNISLHWFFLHIIEHKHVLHM